MPFVVIIGAILVGIVSEKIILKRLKSFTSKTKWEGDDIIIFSLRGMILLWIVIAAISSVVDEFGFQPSIVHILDRTLLVLLILSVTLVIARVTVRFVKHYSGKREGGLPSASIFANITRIVIFLIGILVILDSLGISITPILTALGVGGLAVALALQDTLSNLFSGLHILASRQIQPGNFVKLESGEEGYVVDITWRTTTIRQLPNNIVIIPNSRLASAIVVNYYMPETEMAVLVQVGVSYHSILEDVERVTIEVAKEVMMNVPGGVPTFEPFIRYHTFSDSGINFTVILRASEYVDQYLLKHEFIKRLYKRYLEEGIEIPYPQRDLHIIDSKFKQQNKNVDI